MLEDKELYDFSDLRTYSVENKKVLGKIKDETVGRPIAEFVGLKAKMYSILEENGGQKITAKGVKKKFQKSLTHEHYKAVLDDKIYMRTSMKMFRSFHHEISMIQMNKISLTPYDDKRYLLSDGVTSYAYGHYCICKKVVIWRPWL